MIGDVFAAEGAEDKSVLDGARYRVVAIDLGQRDDLAHVVAGVQAMLFEPLVIRPGFR